MEFITEALDLFWQNLRDGTFQEWGAWNYLILMLLVIIEGPIATLLGAAAASAGFMRVSLVFATVAVGNFLADMGWYALGYYAKEETLLRYGRWLGLRRRHLDRLQLGMHLHARKILLIAKLSTGFIIPSLVAAGLARVPLRRWLPIVLFGEMMWTTILVLIGYYATEAIKQVEVGLHYLAVAGALLFILLLVLLSRSRFRPDRAAELEATTETGEIRNSEEDADEGVSRHHGADSARIQEVQSHATTPPSLNGSGRTKRSKATEE